ncbi:hypothetical protein BH10PSE6_BH10PSE6_25130 [soil metagenome]
MILGLSLQAFVASHVALSLVALLSGAAVVRNLFASRTPAGITALFLATTIATSAGGFLFPSARVGLGHVVGAVSLVVLLPTVLAIYGGHLAGPWRWIYAAGAIAALYLNAVIAVAQTFMKVPVLRPLAYSLTAPSFLLAQAALAALFIGLGVVALRRLHPEHHPPHSVLHPV